MISLLLSLGASLTVRASCSENLIPPPPPTPLEYARALRRRGFNYVKVQRRHARRVADILVRSNFAVRAPTWDQPPYPAADEAFDRVFTYFLTLNSINYMYRNPETGRTYYDGHAFGAGLLAERLTRNLDQITAPHFLKTLKIVEAFRMLSASNDLPEIPRRVIHLRAVGEFLETRPRGRWKAWLAQFPSGLALARHLARHVEGFDDPFLKRAQLFVGQLLGRYPRARDLPKGLRNLDGMSVYADYILPMVLWRMGMLDYAPELAAKIALSEPILNGSRPELEIRAATLIAADALLTELRRHPRYAAITVLDLDAALWLQGREVSFPGSLMPEAVFRRPETVPHITATSNY